MRTGTLAIVTAYEAASLWAQWVGFISAALAVLVAALFGYLTYANNRRSRDNQERASLAASMSDVSRNTAMGLLPAEPGAGGVNFLVRHAAGESWLLINDGPGSAEGVRIEGLTTLDKQRLTVDPAAPTVLEAGQALEFVLVSRLTLSGPANIVVLYFLDPQGSELRKVLQVPAP